MKLFFEKYGNDIVIFLQYIVIIEIFALLGLYFNLFRAIDVFALFAGAINGFILGFFDFDMIKSCVLLIMLSYIAYSVGKALGYY